MHHDAWHLIQPFNTDTKNLTTVLSYGFCYKTAQAYGKIPKIMLLKINSYNYYEKDLKA